MKKKVVARKRAKAKPEVIEHVTKEYRLQDKTVDLRGNVDFEKVYSDATYLIVGDWDYGTVRRVMPISGSLDQVHISWFGRNDKGTCGCWIGDKDGHIIAQIGYDDYADKIEVAPAGSTTDYDFCY